jgi:hypothetical protein
LSHRYISKPEMRAYKLRAYKMSAYKISLQLDALVIAVFGIFVSAPSLTAQSHQERDVMVGGKGVMKLSQSNINHFFSRRLLTLDWSEDLCLGDPTRGSSIVLIDFQGVSVELLCGRPIGYRHHSAAHSFVTPGQFVGVRSVAEGLEKIIKSESNLHVNGYEKGPDEEDYRPVRRQHIYKVDQLLGGGVVVVALGKMDTEEVHDKEKDYAKGHCHSPRQREPRRALIWRNQVRAIHICIQIFSDLLLALTHSLAEICFFHGSILSAVTILPRTATFATADGIK